MDTSTFKEVYGYDEATGAFMNFTQMQSDSNDLNLFNDLYDAFAEKRDERTKAELQALEKELEIRTLNLEKIEYTLELNLELNELSKNKLEAELERISGEGIANAYSRFQNRAQTLNLETFDFTSLIGAFNETFADYNLHKNEETYDKNLAINNLKEYASEIIETEASLRSLLEEQQQDFSDAITEANENLEVQISLMETLKSMTENYKSITQLMGKELIPEANAILKQIDETVLQMSKEALKATQTKMTANEENLRNATLKFNASTGESQEYWKEEMERLQQEGLELEEQAISNLEATLSAASELFANNIARAILDMESALAEGFGSLEYLQDYYEQQKAIDDLYLDEFERTYEINKLMRSLSKSIDDTSNISAKQKLKEVQDEINQAAEKENELTSQDIELLNKKYELRLAEIALEEAQNEKTQVRLTKNESGSWSYVYTASQSDIDKATQDYEDKLYALQKANKEYTTQWSDYLLELETNFGSGLNEILDMEFNTVQEKINAINEFLEGSLIKLEAGIRGIQTNLALDKDLGGSGSLADTIFEKYGDLDNLYSTISKAFTGLTGTAIEELDEREKTINEITNMITDKDIDEYLSSSVEDFGNRSTEALSTIEEMANELSYAYVNLGNNLYSFQDIYNEVMTEIQTSTDTTIEKLQELMSELSPIATAGSSIITIQAEGNAQIGDVNISTAQKYDTGGYTGEWGTSGKLALLHEKELVLNKYDTENLLNTMSVLNEVLNKMGKYNSVRDFTGLTSQFGSSLNQTLSNSETLQQEVNIHAEFPNATDHSEIEQAFDNLVNMASQYANQKL